MKKLISGSCAATTLVACSQSAGDKFVGTWTVIGNQNNPIKWVIAKNNGDSGYTVTDPKQQSFTGVMDGDTFIYGVMH